MAAPGATRTDAGAPARTRPQPIAIVAALTAIAAVVIVAVIALSGGGQRAIDDHGRERSARIPAGNLTDNPSFERNTDGWDTYQEGVRANTHS